MARRSARRPSGQLETAVLAALWSAGRSLTPSQVQEAMSGEPAYTTVLTTLQRLHAKGQLQRENQGRTHAYRPTREAARTAADTMHSLLGTGNGREIVLNHFVDALSAEDEELLRDMLSRRFGPAGD